MMEALKRRINILTNLLIGYQTGLIRPAGGVYATSICRPGIGSAGNCGLVTVELPVGMIGKKYGVTLMEAGDEHQSVVQAQAPVGGGTGGLG